MRIVFLNVTGSLGGAERVLLTLLRQLRRMRPDWHLTVLAGDAGPLLPAAEELGCATCVLPLGQTLAQLGDWGNGGQFGALVRALPEAVRYRAALRQRLREFAPHIVQTNGFKMHVLGAFACPSSVRLIWHIHDFVANRRVMKMLLRWCSNRPAAIVAISPAVAASLSGFRRVRAIWNSVDLDRFRPVALPEHPEVRIGLVATFARWKGHDVFLEALASLPRDFGWRAFIVGGGIYRRAASQWTEQELRDLVRKHRLESKVEFTGFLSDPAPFLQTLEIVVHASTEAEPFGLTIAEGMAAGKAVVTTSAAFVTSEVDGIVCRPDSLAAALERLARDPELRRRLGAAAAESAAQRFRPERMAGEFIALYEAAP